MKTPLACLAVVAGLLLNVAGCSHGGSSAQGQAQSIDSNAQEKQVRQAERTEEVADRQQLEQILPPSKSLYLGVRSQAAYGNPFLVVHQGTVTLSILFPDENPNAFDNGGMLRPVSARRKHFEVRLPELPNALASLPPEVWPYGRVVAVEEAPSSNREARVAIRRNVEQTIQILNDLGVVVDEWTGATGTLLR